jgi:2-C-methyl-D-erythritol 4-phosphate cytidylyltransferase
MGAAIPKQYLPLAGKTVLEHTLTRLLAHPRITEVMVALGTDDGHWPALGLARDGRIRRVDGGAERCHSVLNALDALAGRAAPDDWVLVHDAARPCVRTQDLTSLMAELASDPVGGILAIPVRDTMKRGDEQGRIRATEERTGLWHALTPQMFRLEPLRRALRQALADGFLVTDEASAMEHAGARPRLVEGHGDNIKITRPGDLALAEFYLTQQAVE